MLFFKNGGILPQQHFSYTICLYSIEMHSQIGLEETAVWIIYTSNIVFCPRRFTFLYDIERRFSGRVGDKAQDFVT